MNIEDALHNVYILIKKKCSKTTCDKCKYYSIEYTNKCLLYESYFTIDKALSKCEICGSRDDIIITHHGTVCINCYSPMEV